MTNTKDQAGIELEDAIAQAIQEFERKTRAKVIGVSVTRIGSRDLMVEAIVIPRSKEGA